MSGCLTSWPATSSCSWGYCNTSSITAQLATAINGPTGSSSSGICICENGWTGASDMVAHGGRDCASNTTLVTMVWCFALAVGVITLIGGIVKLRQSWHATAPEPSAPGAAPIGAGGAAAAAYRVTGPKPSSPHPPPHHHNHQPHHGSAPVPVPPPPVPISIITQGLTPKASAATTNGVGNGPIVNGPRQPILITAQSAPPITTTITAATPRGGTNGPMGSPKGVALASAAVATLASSATDGGSGGGTNGGLALTISSSPKASPISVGRRASINGQTGAMIIGATRPRSAYVVSSHQTAATAAGTTPLSLPPPAPLVPLVVPSTPLAATVLTSPPPTEPLASPAQASIGGDLRRHQSLRHHTSDSLHQRRAGDSKLGDGHVVGGGPTTPLARQHGTGTGTGTDVSQHGTDKANKETEPSSGHGTAAAAANYAAQVKARRYRAWVKRATTTLGFRLSIYLILIGVSQLLTASLRIAHPQCTIARCAGPSFGFAVTFFHFIGPCIFADLMVNRYIPYHAIYLLLIFVINGWWCTMHYRPLCQQLV
jgi:hypothetical protein